MKTVSYTLALSIGFGATASAQPQLVAPTMNAARAETPEAARSATSLADAARSQARRLVTNETAWKRTNQATSHAPRDGDAIAFAVGATAGGLLGFGIAGRVCHCESSKGAFIGLAIGGVGGLLLYRALTN